MTLRRSLACLVLSVLLASAAGAQDRRPPPPPPPRGGQPPPRDMPPPQNSPPAQPTQPMTPAPNATPTPAPAATPAATPTAPAASATAAQEAAVDAAKARGDRADIGAALVALAGEHRRLRRPDRALPVLEEAIALADRSSDDRLGREASLAAAQIHADSGDRALEKLWRDRADAYRLRIAEGIGAAPLPPPPASAGTPPPAAEVAAPATGVGDAAIPADPAANPARWAWLLLPVALVFGWAWLRSHRNAERLAEETERLARHKRQLSTANSQLQEQASRLREQAVTDALTGAMTRVAFARQFEEVLLHASHYGKPVALMVFDLDHFKQINDTHGHLSGDAALKFVAGIVRESLASDDLFGRFGGDEFLIACADHDRDVAFKLAEHIRTAVTARAPQENPAFAALSLSIGVAIADGSSGYRSELLFHRADAALYAAKRAGRNKSVVEDTGTPEPPRDIHAPRSLSAMPGT